MSRIVCVGAIPAVAHSLAVPVASRRERIADKIRQRRGLIGPRLGRAPR